MNTATTFNTFLQYLSLRFLYNKIISNEQEIPSALTERMHTYVCIYVHHTYIHICVVATLFCHYFCNVRLIRCTHIFRMFFLFLPLYNTDKNPIDTER